MKRERISVLILCTQNSCRSQMAEAILRALRPGWEIYSAGTEPSERVHPKAVEVMRELGFDLSSAEPKNVSRFLHRSFDFVLTVCDKAHETCPVFAGEVRHRIHIGFEDPASASGTEEEVAAAFRRVRDQIQQAMREFVRKVDSGELWE